MFLWHLWEVMLWSRLFLLMSLWISEWFNSCFTPVYVFLCLINLWAFPFYVPSPSLANLILVSHAQDGSEFALFQKDPNSLWIWEAIFLSNDNDITANGAFLDCIAMVSLPSLTSPCEIPLHKACQSIGDHFSLQFALFCDSFLILKWFLFADI